MVAKRVLGARGFAQALRRNHDGSIFAYTIGYTRLGKPGVGGVRRNLCTIKARSEKGWRDAVEILLANKPDTVERAQLFRDGPACDSSG